MDEKRRKDRRREDSRVLEIEKWKVFVDLQIGRIVSDAESEKGTRARANKDLNDHLEKIDERIRSIEMKLYIAAGAIVSADYLFRIFVS